MGIHLVPGDPSLERLRVLYFTVYHSLPWLIPGALLFSCVFVLLLMWKIDRQTVRFVFPFLGIDMTAILLLAPLGLSFGRPFVPIFSFWIIRIVSSYITLHIGKLAGVKDKIKIGGVIALNVILTGFCIYGFYIEPFALKTRVVHVETGKFQDSGGSLKILHISDVHLEYPTFRERNLIEKCEDLKPDIILLTGDYLNLSNLNDARSIAEFREIAKRLRAPLGVFAVGGSGEQSPGYIENLFQGSDARILWNEIARIDSGGKKMEILGIPCSHNLRLDRKLLSQIIEKSDPGKFRILLYHSPDLFPEAAASGIDLILSGHTHGGQICLPFFGPILTASVFGRKFPGGTYALDQSTMIVSRGVGMEGMDAPRVRFLAPPEIVAVEISGKTR